MSDPSAELQALYDRREDLASMTSDNDSEISSLEDEEFTDWIDEIEQDDNNQRAADMNAELSGGGW